MVSRSVLADKPFVDQFLCLGKLHPGILSIGDGCSDGCDLFVGRYDVRALAVDAELSFRLAERAFRTLNSKLKFPRVQLDEDLAGLDFLAEIGVHAGHCAVYLAADTNLIGGNQTAGEFHHALDRNTLRRRAFDLNGFSIASAPAAALPSLSAALAFLLGLGCRSRPGERGESQTPVPNGRNTAYTIS